MKFSIFLLRHISIDSINVQMHKKSNAQINKIIITLITDSFDL